MKQAPFCTLGTTDLYELSMLYAALNDPILHDRHQSLPLFNDQFMDIAKCRVQ